MEYLKQSLEDTIIFNQKISTLSPENNLLLLCGHGTKDCWNKLSRISDIAELINYYPQLNWQLLLKEAKNRGALRLVLVGLSLANRLYQISLPDFLYDEINKDTKIKSLVNKIENILFMASNTKKKILRQFLFQIQFRERFKDKIKPIFNLIFLPNYIDWLLFAPYELPLICYYFLSPFTLLFKIVFKLKNQ
ncbi:MAG: nucleotidyltransferase family protein [Geminocystis sp. GBBB08]|nr:nucleotidyltransferase family protein [Geminocystis sp. GBBB08]